MTHSRLANILRLISGGAEEAEMKGWRERAADMSQKRGVIGGSKGDGVC